MSKNKKKSDVKLIINTEAALPINISVIPEKPFGRLSFSYLALFTLLYVALPSFVLSVFLLLRIGSPQSAYCFSMAVLAGIIYYNRDKLSIGDYILFFIILLICHVYAYMCFDGSSDGIMYHLPAVRRITNGFNPVYDGYMNFGRPPDVWSDQATYFPKATWYFSAAVTAVFGDIQIGKAYNLLLIFAALFFVLGSTKNERIFIRVLWVIACLNPAATTQIQSYLVDGALGSLCTISLFYAYLFFNDKPISRLQHVFCIVSLSMLYCVKTSGFGYGCIIMFFIILNGFIKKCCEKSELARLRLLMACKTALQLSLKLGIPVFLLVLVWGFAPYATNILNGKHIFYPLIYDGSERSNHVNSDMEELAAIVYPNANNRFSRLMYSIASHTVVDIEGPLKTKSPFDLSLSDWKAFGEKHHIIAAGLGPLFFLLLLLSVPVLFIYRFNGNGWLLLTLLALLFIQPYSWIMRFAPFLWILPFACLMSLPEKRRVFLWAPLIIAFINIFGVSYFKISAVQQFYDRITQYCSTFAGEIVMLPQTELGLDSLFERFGIRQKFINPEEIGTKGFYNRNTFRWTFLNKNPTLDGVNMILKKHLLPLPETPLDFAEEVSFPWLGMSEGLAPVERPVSNYGRKLEWITYANKVKFYMSLDKEPKGDWEITLKGAMFDDWGVVRNIDVIVFINNHMVGTWQIDNNTKTATFKIPRNLMEESFRDETHLVTLMLQLQGIPSWLESGGQASVYGLKLDGMQFRQK